MPYTLLDEENPPAKGGYTLLPLNAKPAAGSQQSYDDEAARYLESQRQERLTQARAEGNQTGRDIAMFVPNLAAGGLRGAGSIGATLVAPLDIASDALAGKGLTLASNRRRRADLDYAMESIGADTNSLGYGIGKLGGEIAGTAGVGGVAANGVRVAAPLLTRAGASAPAIERLATSVASSGFRTGAPAATTLRGKVADLALRSAGGAITGGASAALINPSDASTGAAVGGALPPGLAATGKLAGYGGRALYSLAQPFSKAGQENLAGRIINRFAEGGPTALDLAEHVPGSMPTLAEATGNAGIARLQSGTRDLRVNPFVERETANHGARNAAFDNLAGDAGKLDFFKASRRAAADDLYGQALAADTSANFTPYVKGQVTQLLKRPSIHEARKTAQRWAIERGEKPSFDANMTGLHDIKTALDDQISEAVRAGKGGEAKALSATQDKLLMTMEKLSPEYKQARVTYAEMSKPVNQMETLQGLRLTDAKGNITLSKVQNALDSLEQRMAQSGTDPAKSLTTDQVNVLKSIRDDLLRQSRTGAGKSAGSNTFQNIATDNIISSILPGKIGEIVGNKVGGVAGQIGRLAYSGPNEAIRNRLVELMLDPVAAQGAMAAAKAPTLQQLAGTRINSLRTRINSLLDSHPAVPLLYRSVPVLSSSR